MLSMIRKFIMDKVEGEVENKTRIGGKFINFAEIGEGSMQYASLA